MVLDQAAQMRVDENLKKMEIKIQMARLKWFEENFEKVFNDPFKPSHLKPKKAEYLYKRIMEVRRDEFEREQNMKEEERIKKEETRKKMISLVDNRDEIFQKEKEIMYPIPCDIHRILYNGVSQTGEGRWLYLKVRNKMAPHDKFLRKITETMEYGWKIDELGERPIKSFNRMAIIQDSFYRRFGAIKPESMRKNPPFSKAQISVEVL